ncbi:MAG: hypothetical protein KBG39_10735 [Opitutaceae bacterium]|jgi:phage FluMu protein gp41|nr:hypothetical protein [Opitutaceae bacterium]MBP8963407.1 hypothetical protein [Opitutaceae bacterium]HQL22466.1 hypothetical protein [Opitutaceae bacterium]
MPAPLQTEIEFQLPRGYVAPDGTLHRQGVMRMATAADEILPMKDPRVQQNPAYLTVVLLARVIKQLGTVSPINTFVIESLFTADLAYLQQVYARLNGGEADAVSVTCPHCGHQFTPEPAE